MAASTDMPTRMRSEHPSISASHRFASLDGMMMQQQKMALDYMEALETRLLNLEGIVCGSPQAAWT